MHQGSCHCGAVKLKLPSTPTVATSCNCSLCRRIGGPWVYFEFGTVKIEGKKAQQLLSMMEALEEHEDVQNVWANFDIDEAEITEQRAAS